MMEASGVFAIRMRDDFVVCILKLPRDLTMAEAPKIARVMMALVDEPGAGSRPPPSKTVQDSS
jgi:hypothetical protein